MPWYPRYRSNPRVHQTVKVSVISAVSVSKKPARSTITNSWTPGGLHWRTLFPVMKPKKLHPITRKQVQKREPWLYQSGKCKVPTRGHVGHSGRPELP